MTVDNNPQDHTTANRIVTIVTILMVIVVAVGFYYFVIARDSRGSSSTPTSEITATPEVDSQLSPTTLPAVEITSFTVSSERVYRDECVDIAWVVEHADSIQLFRDETKLLFQSEPSDTFRDCIPEVGTVVYRLAVGSSSGSMDESEIRVVVSERPTPTPAATATQLDLITPTTADSAVVTSAPNNAPIAFLSYSVYPDRVTAGGCVDLTWSVQNADSLQLERNGSVIIEDAPASVTFNDCLDTEGTAVYRLNASQNNGDPDFMQLQVIVSGTGPTTTQGPSTTTFNPVTIMYYYVEPTRISRSQCTVVHWDVRNADTIRLLRNDKPVLENAIPLGTFQDCLDYSGIARYRLEVNNVHGFYNYLTLEVIVN